MNQLHPNWFTAIVLSAVIGAFLFMQAEEHGHEFKQAAELEVIQKEEAAKASREFAGQQVCGPGARAQWDGDVLSCIPKRGKPYTVAEAK
jgi:hypothetical protein